MIQHNICEFNNIFTLSVYFLSSTTVLFMFLIKKDKVMFSFLYF